MSGVESVKRPLANYREGPFWLSTLSVVSPRYELLELIFQSNNFLLQLSDLFLKHVIVPALGLGE